MIINIVTKTHYKNTYLQKSIWLFCEEGIISVKKFSSLQRNILNMTYLTKLLFFQ